MQVQIMWQHVLVTLQNILNCTQDVIMQNNRNLRLHKQMILLNNLFSEAREIRSKLVEEAIGEGNVQEMLSVVSNAENELKKIVALSVCMQNFVYVREATLFRSINRIIHSRTERKKANSCVYDDD